MGSGQGNGFPTQVIIIIAIITVVLIILGILLFVLLNKNKGKKLKIKIDEEFINNLILNYGGISNIKSCDVDNGRLKVAVNDLDLVNLPALKEQSQAGVFVTANIIKTLYKFDSKLIKSLIDKQL